MVFFPPDFCYIAKYWNSDRIKLLVGSVTLVKVSDLNSFRINQIYSEICFRANPNSFESIRKKFSISFDVVRLKINPSQSKSIRDFESEWIRTNLSILMNPKSEFFGLIRIEYSI